MPAPERRRAPRSDGLANRERILTAAVVAVRAGGERVPLAEIAERAGVGIGTLYRHFPTRERLLEALTVRAFALVRTHALAAARRDGPAIDAIAAFFDQTIDHRDELLLPLHGSPARLSDEARALQAEIRGAFNELLRRGRGDGSVRDDVTARDIVIAGAQLAQPLAGVEDWTAVARRQARIFTSGLRPIEADKAKRSNLTG